MGIPTNINDNSLPQVNWSNATADVVKKVSTGQVGLRINGVSDKLYDPSALAYIPITGTDKVYEGTIDQGTPVTISFP